MMFLKGFILVIIAGFLSSCAETKVAKEVEHSGFLGTKTYSMLRDGDPEQLEPVKVYRSEKTDWRQYNKVILDPIALFLDEENKEEVSEEDSQNLVDRFYNVIYKGIDEDPRWEITSTPGPGTTRIQIAITSLGATSVTMDTVSTVIPQARLLSTIATIGRDKPAFVGEFGVEIKVKDSQTGKLLMAGVDKRYGGKTLGKGSDTWSDVYNIMDYYVALFRYRTCILQKRENCVKPGDEEES